MKFEVEFCSTQQYLPSQRHKKLRCRCENHFFDVEVSEVRNDEFPVAFIVSSELKKYYPDFQNFTEIHMLLSLV